MGACTCLCVERFVGLDAVKTLLGNQMCMDLQHFIIYQQ